MELTDNEIKFLKLIYENEEIGLPIGFSDDDHEKVKKYKEKYGCTYKSLSEKLLVGGSIDYNSYLVLTPIGKKVLIKIFSEEKEKSEVKEKEKSKVGIIIGIISVILGLLGIYITIRFSR